MTEKECSPSSKSDERSFLKYTAAAACDLSVIVKQCWRSISALLLLGLLGSYVAEAVK